MDSYLTTQRATIFQNVGVLIYVFDVESREMSKDLEYYRDCLEALRKYSPDAVVFLLVHKMDLVRNQKGAILERKIKDLRENSGETPITVFGTSIYDESLYKAWSRIVHSLIPNAAILTKHLKIFAEACSATEVVLFERTTFLVIATSHETPTPPTAANGVSTADLTLEDPDDLHKLDSTRYERTSELIKAFKHSCTRMREDFRSLDMELPDYTAVLDELTKNTYIMVVVHDPTIETAAIKINIRLAREKFEELQSETLP